MSPVNALNISHILVSPCEQLTYLSCSDIRGKIYLFCIYAHRQVKTYTGDEWITLNDHTSRDIINLCDRFLNKRPTFTVNNIAEQFCN